MFPTPPMERFWRLFSIVWVALFLLIVCGSIAFFLSVSRAREPIVVLSVENATSTPPAVAIDRSALDHLISSLNERDTRYRELLKIRPAFPPPAR